MFHWTSRLTRGQKMLEIIHTTCHFKGHAGRISVWNINFPLTKKCPGDSDRKKSPSFTSGWPGIYSTKHLSLEWKHRLIVPLQWDKCYLFHPYCSNKEVLANDGSIRTNFRGTSFDIKGVYMYSRSLYLTIKSLITKYFELRVHTFFHFSRFLLVFLLYPLILREKKLFPKPANQNT